MSKSKWIQQAGLLCMYTYICKYMHVKNYRAVMILRGSGSTLEEREGIEEYVEII